jgi:hypothetical protein
MYVQHISIVDLLRISAATATTPAPAAAIIADCLLDRRS